jgi:hypothetical protein
VNLLEPWVLLRLLAGLVALALFARGAVTSWRVLRHFDIARASEGQLALERQVQLAATFVRVGTVVQVGTLVLTVVLADRLSRVVRGAMCAYGVFQANEWGFRAFFSTFFIAVAAGVLAQLYALDARMRTMGLVRPLAVATLIMAPLALGDLLTSYMFLSKLDLSVVASCCSTQLDTVSSAANSYAAGPRAIVAFCAPCAIGLSALVGMFAARRPRVPLVAVAGALSIATFPVALAAAVLEVAPHAFEVPQHVCPFCLLKGEVFFLGYPLFGAILVAVIWGAGAALGGVLARSPEAQSAFASFARERLRRGAFAWLVALAIGVAPVLRYAVVSGGASLFR